MLRRELLTTTIGGAAGLAAGGLARPSLAQPAGARTLRFIPQSDVTVLDPVVTTAYVTRHHGFLIWDQLYGVDADFKPQPQMVEGHVIEDDGKRYTMTLRPGLRFHDGSPVRAADAVASIRRWGARDALGQALLAATESLRALDDRRFEFRLKRPFPPLLDALAKPGTPVLFVMPERLASGDPAVPVREMIGSGPFRWKGDERVPGSRAVYERFAGYVPREGGTAVWTSGPKRANLDRVEWHVIPDAGTAAAALQNGEVEWWEQPTGDLLPTLMRNRDVVTETYDPTGLMGLLRFNHLHPPFNNPGIRRALLGAVTQSDYQTAVIGTDRSLWREGVGYFPPGTALASDAGLEAITAPRDLEKVKRDLAAAGYRGEKVTLMGASDFPSLNALTMVADDMLKRAGMNVDLITTDWGSVVQRRASREPVARGGWDIFCTFFTGLDMINPGVHQAMRGNGLNAWFGWPTMPEVERLREAWLVETDADKARGIGADLQRQAFRDVPYLPLGQYFQPWAYRRGLTGVLKGLPMFWNVARG